MTRLSLLAAVCLLASCGSDEPTNNVVVDGGVADTDASLPRKFAFVTVERWSRGASETYTMAGLRVFHTDATMPRIGPIDEHCRVHEGAWPTDGRKPPSFGTVQLTGGSEGQVTFSDGPDGPGWLTEPAKTPGWKPGDSMTVQASGADLPGFTLGATVPEAAMLTSIDMPKLLELQLGIERTKPMTLTWTPTTGEVLALILQFQPTADLAGVQCFFPGSAGTGTIPVAALAKLQALSGQMRANFYFFGVERKRAALEGVDVELMVINGWSTKVRVE